MISESTDCDCEGYILYGLNCENSTILFTLDDTKVSYILQLVPREPKQITSLKLWGADLSHPEILNPDFANKEVIGLKKKQEYVASFSTNLDKVPDKRTQDLVMYYAKETGLFYWREEITKNNAHTGSNFLEDSGNQYKVFELIEYVIN